MNVVELRNVYKSPEGYTYTLDGDGGRIWDLPEAWSFSKPAEEMNTKTLIAAVQSEVFGCKVKWSGYYGNWCCGRDCEGDHACDQQCSILAEPLVRKCALEIEKRGGVCPPASATDKEIWVALLNCVREGRNS